MADQKLTDRGSLSESKDSSYVHVVQDGASLKQTKSNFLKEDRTRIEDLELTKFSNTARIDNIENNQYSGVITYELYSTLLSVSGVVNTSYKVTNDPDTSLNGYYHWSGSAYVKDADLANGIIESGNVDAVSGGTVFTAIEDYSLANGIIESGNTDAVSGGTVYETLKYKADLEVGKNLINKDTLTEGYWVTKDDVITEYALYSYTDFIKVEAGVDYVTPEATRCVTYYDKYYNQVTGGNNFWSSFTPPTGVEYIRVSVYNATIDTIQLEVGTVPTFYEKYSKKIPVEQIDIDAINSALTNKADVVIGKNKWNKDTSTPGFYISFTTGLPVANVNYSYSVPIPVEEGQEWITNETLRAVCFFDENMVKVVGGSNYPISFTIPVNVYFIQISIYNVNFDTQQLELGTVPTAYEKWNYSVPKEQLTLFLEPEDITDAILVRNIDKENAVEASAYKGSLLAKNLQLLIVADVHSDDKRMYNAGLFLEHYGTVDGCINLGDTTDEDFTENIDFYTNFVTDATKPVLTIIGNHDVGNTKLVADCGTNAEVYAKFIQPFETQSGGVYASESYHYRDFVDEKIRVINLYEYDDPNDLDTDTSYYKIFRGTTVWSQAQITWFTTTLLNTPTDYSVVVGMHQSVDANMTFLTNDFSSPNATLPFYQSLVSGDPIPTIIDAFINGTNLVTSFTHTGDAAYLSTVNISVDFTARGVGEFICYLAGHHHQDMIATVDAFPTQKQVYFVCSTISDGKNQFSDLNRTEDKKSQDALTIMSFDTTNKKINLVRIGSDITQNLTERKQTSIDY